MPVLSAVLTLSADPDRQRAALAALGAEPRVAVGPQQRDRLPVVLSSDTRDEDRALWRWAERLPGVLHTELVFADFSDLPVREAQS